MRTRGSDGSILRRFSKKRVRDDAESSSRNDRDDVDNHLRTRANRVTPTSSHPRRIEETRVPHTICRRGGRVGRFRG